MKDWLDRIDVASPCEESWAGMQGEGRERHCDRCEQSVYDLSEMTRAEAEALVLKSAEGEQVCIRFRRRADGTVLTADCPSQVRAARDPWRQVRAAAAGFLALAGGLAAGGCTDEVVTPATRGGGAQGSGGAATAGQACCPDGQGDCCLQPKMGEVMVEPPPAEPVLMGAPRPSSEIEEEARRAREDAQPKEADAEDQARAPAPAERPVLEREPEMGLVALPRRSDLEASEEDAQDCREPKRLPIAGEAE